MPIDEDVEMERKRGWRENPPSLAESEFIEFCSCRPRIQALL